jgi:hypothetical protein
MVAESDDLSFKKGCGLENLKRNAFCQTSNIVAFMVIYYDGYNI